MPAFPEINVDLFYMTIYGGYGYDRCECSGYLRLANGVAQPGNPPYTVNNLLAMYPKFFGPPVSVPAVLAGTNIVTGVPNPAGLASGQLVTGQSINPGTVITAVNTSPIEFIGDTTQGSAVLTNATSVAGLVIGNPISGGSIPSGAVILAIDPIGLEVGVSLVAGATAASVEFAATATSLTLSSAATASGNATLTVYTFQLVPLIVIQTYLNLANASLMSSRWREAWPLAMSLYIAHFLTLFLQTDGNPQTTAGQAVTNGLQAGILTSQSADGVSMGIQPLAALDNWAAWTLTSYGTQLATMARVVGAGATYYR
jgi:hypothetical protein